MVRSRRDESVGDTFPAERRRKLAGRTGGTGVMDGEEASSRPMNSCTYFSSPSCCLSSSLSLVPLRLGRLPGENAAGSILFLGDRVDCRSRIVSWLWPYVRLQTAWQKRLVRRPLYQSCWPRPDAAGPLPALKERGLFCVDRFLRPLRKLEPAAWCCGPE